MEARAVSALAFIIVLGFFGIVGTLIFHEVPAGSKDILGPLIGVIGAAVGTIVGYIWGSSSGSKAHSQTVKELTGTGDGSGKVITNVSTKTDIVKTIEAPVPTETLAAWAVGTPYKVGDHVTVGTEKYSALSNHTSTAEDEPGTGPSWTAAWERQA